MQGELIGIARRPRPRAPMESIEAAAVAVASGVEGDYAGVRRGASTGRRQVTVLTSEGWQAACAELGAELPWLFRRANLLVRGLDLEERAGGILEIGEVRLEITGEMDPCERMDAQHAGLMAALNPAWRGGVTCRVLEDGMIRTGDPVGLVPPPPERASSP